MDGVLPTDGTLGSGSATSPSTSPWNLGLCGRACANYRHRFARQFLFKAPPTICPPTFRSDVWRQGIVYATIDGSNNLLSAGTTPWSPQLIMYPDHEQ